MPLTKKRPIPHGTVNGYKNYGCRCQGCRDAWAPYHLAYMRRHPEQLVKNRLRMRKARATA